MSFEQIDDRARAKSAFDQNVLLVRNLPPPANPADGAKEEDQDPKWFDPRHWRRRTVFLFVIISAITVVIVVAVAVTEVKKNAYPDYSKLNYTLVDRFSGTSFFNNFNYFIGYDPTAGFVHYLDPEQAKQFNLTYATANSAVIKVDTTQQNASTGRYSVRITSKATYSSGLFVFDVAHTPYGCATWPALWLTDPSNWPTNGEIDVMESVNQATTGNQMTLHTTADCSMAVKRKETGTDLTDNCYNGTDSNSGCGVQGESSTFGPSFNAAGGGVMAMELRQAGIRMWQFARSSIPADITDQSPDPSSWPEALADFPSTNCDIGGHFQNMSIIADIDICGSWAGNPSVYSGQDSCPGLCTTFAANNPAAFADAYWEFGPTGFAVYQST